MFVPTTISDLHPADVARAAEVTRHLRPPRAGSARQVFRVIIAELLEMIEACGMDEDAARNEFRRAWVWGLMTSPAYKVWRDEIALQRGLMRGRRTPGHPTAWLRMRRAEAAGQMRIEAAI
jgi:hypothetical protein